jgi:hypothetical protein
MMTTAPITTDQQAWSLVWVIHPDVAFETEWIRHLLSEMPCGESIDPRLSSTHPRTMFVVGDDGLDPTRSEQFISRLENARMQGIIVGLVHVSDRFYRAPSALYDAASFVIRVGHWHGNVAAKVLAVPIGPAASFLRAVRGGLEHEMTPALQRRYRWSFAGQVRSKPTREAMARAFRQVPNGYLYETEMFKDPHALGGDDYKAILSQSTFALCPRAMSVKALRTTDTFRAWEAAAVGAIPLVDNSYYAEAFGAPFPQVLADWSDGPRFIEDACREPDQLAALQRQCHDWWARYWRDAPRLVRQHVDVHAAAPWVSRSLRTLQ